MNFDEFVVVVVIDGLTIISNYLSDCNLNMFKMFWKRPNRRIKIGSAHSSIGSVLDVIGLSTAMHQFKGLCPICQMSLIGQLIRQDKVLTISKMHQNVYEHLCETLLVF